MALVHSIRAGASAVSRSAASAEAASTLAFATWACSSRLASGPGRTFAASPWEAPSLIPLGSSLTEDQENDKPMAPCAAYYGSLHYSQDPFASQVSVTAPRQACAFPGSFPWAVAAALRQADGSVAPLSWQPEASLSQGLDSARQSATALVRGQAHALTSSPWQSRGHAVRLLSAPAPDASGRRTATGQPQTTPSPGGAAKVSKGAAPVSTSATAEDLAEECDEAVEDLGEVRKRVKAAKEAMRKGKGVIRASWLVVTAVLGRAWGAVASLRVLMTWSRQDWMNTFSRWWSVIKHEANHYWVGTKLLWADIRISSRLLLKTAKGTSLTRRERQQLTRTSADIFRLVPFAVFVIVPFMEFLLPLALRLFPNMLPSTYQDAKQEEAKLKRVLQARLQMAKFLQDTVQEMAKEIKGRRDGQVKKNADDLQKFLLKIRTGGRVSNDEIMGFASLFNDELTLDSMTRPRLVSMCKYMGLQTFGTDAYLRYILRARLAWIKEDDKMIQAEGVESLSEAELRAACRERGMLGMRDVKSMQDMLRDWLDLSLNRSVPSSLLILSRAFLLAGKVKPEEAVQATLSSLPEVVVESVGASVKAAAEPAGSAKTSERQRKLDKLRQEELLIKEEEEAAARQKAAAAAAASAAAEGARDRALEEMRLDKGALAAPGAPRGGLALEGAAAEDVQQMTQDRVRANRDQLCNLSAALAVLASSSAVSKERVDFLRLVNREIEMYNSLVEKTGSEGEEEARAAYAAAREASEREATADTEEAEGEGVSEALISKVDTMLHQLEKELDRVDAKIGSKLRILDTDYDGKVTPEEVAAAAAMLRDSLGQGEVSELIANLAKDREGKILVEDIVRLGTVDTPDDSADEEPPLHMAQQSL